MCHSPGAARAGDAVLTGAVALTGAVVLAGRTAPSRALFGPHETNLGRGRALSGRHVAYYERRAAGGAGLIVTETASVHGSDWPYERAPLAAECGDGWAAVTAACRPHGALVLAGLGHAGSQGSSAYSQQALWAPSRVADVVSRELPMELEAEELDALVNGFAAAAALAADSGLDGVELEAGQNSVLRQFASGLTNHRKDGYGADHARLLTEVIAAVRAAIGDRRVLGLRLSCDELAPWAGITPEQGVELAAALAGSVDYLVPVRGSAMSGSATRPDLHTPPGFNTELCAAVRRAVDGRTAVVLQGSVVDPAQAQDALADGVADLVELTRAQIADPDLVALVRRGAAERVRPCVLSNQKCRVRDPRNPIVSCVGEPRSGHETEDPDVGTGADAPLDVLVVGAGPAGLEAARVLALRGHRVEIADRAERAGGTLRLAALLAGRGRLVRLVDWLEAEVRRLGVRIATGVTVTAGDLDGRIAVLATGSVPGPRSYRADGPVLEARDLLARLAGGEAPRDVLPDGPLVVVDPIGDWTGVGMAELLAAAGWPTTIVSQDPVIGTQLSLTGDLADANTRLQRAGVTLATRSRLRGVQDGTATLVDVYTAQERTIECAAIVHCGHRLPNVLAPGWPSAGDCVAPRTAHEAILEGRRAAMAVATARLVAV